MPTPSENDPGGFDSPDHPPPGGQTGSSGNRRKRTFFQRIGWRRPSAGERKLWIIQGIIVLAAVLLIGTLMFWALS